jgi:hypothetical protein
LTKDEIHQLQITRIQAEAALDFYRHEFRRNPGNVTAAARAKLMEQLLSQI